MISQTLAATLPPLTTLVQHVEDVKIAVADHEDVPSAGVTEQAVLPLPGQPRGVEQAVVLRHVQGQRLSGVLLFSVLPSLGSRVVLNRYEYCDMSRGSA